ncbi:MAG TPA: DNA methyltransferase [Planctomycetaceae bacterium]|nr:DNA methyltransferase [Planctomycetaceae bacterium]
MDLDYVTRRFSNAYERIHESLVTSFRGRLADERRRQQASDVLNRLMFACFTEDPARWHAPRDLESVVDGQPALSGAARRRLLDFARDWQWRLTDGPPARATEVTPGVLGLILERHVNQRQTGSYYTRADVTHYIAQAAIIPALLDAFGARCRDEFSLDEALRRRLAGDPVRYLHPALRTGAVSEDGAILRLPSRVAPQSGAVDSRDSWNAPADAAFALPGETWRDVIERRTRCLAVYDALRTGRLTSIDDLVTWNLDLGRLAGDVIRASDEPQVAETFYELLAGGPDRGAGPRAAAFHVLDPTCGSGAFLVAALDLLEPLYEACLTRLEPSPAGRNRRAGIRRTIIARNLYGVDLLPEAIAMCRLRLRLKVAAVASGCKSSQTGSRLDSVAPLRSDTAVRRGAATRGTPADNLRVGDALSGPAGQPRRTTAAASRTNGSAFDWRSAFPRILSRGGFDVVIGNPPYIETARAEQAAFRGFQTARTGNLFAPCTERSLNLLRPGGRLGVILPMSAASTPRMRPLMELICERLSPVWLSHFACRPGKLFAGADMNVTIVLGFRRTDFPSVRPAAVAWSPEPAELGTVPLPAGRTGSPSYGEIYTTGYQRWSTASRPSLFSTLGYTPTELLASRGTIPKLNSDFERRLLHKLLAFAGDGRLRESNGSPPSRRTGLPTRDAHGIETVYFHSGGRYFRKCLRQKLSNEYKPLHVPAGWGDASVCLLSSSLFYWMWIALSDCYHVTDRDLRYLPLAESLVTDPELSRLARCLVDDLWAHSETRARRRADGTTQREVNFDVARSKSLLDEVDRVLGRHFALTDAQIDFILNYDGQYRVARVSGRIAV